MADKVINLNKVRKQKKKSEKKAVADVNRVKFGQTKSERQKSKTINQRKKEVLDQHHLKNDDPASDS